LTINEDEVIDKALAVQNVDYMGPRARVNHLKSALVIDIVKEGTKDRHFVDKLYGS
jgi:hypothetical protein